MNEPSYRTGQAARLLNVSAHHIRKLCEAELIEADITDGNRWRIPAREVERLKAGGVPPIPQMPAPSVKTLPASVANRQATHYREPRAEDDWSGPECLSEEVQAEADSLAIAEKRLNRRRLELEQEDVEDSFREREKRRRAEEDAQRRAQQEEATRRARNNWKERWLKYALSCVPRDAPAECELSAYREAEAALNDLMPGASDEIVRQLIAACVRKALAPYFRQRQVQSAVVSVLNGLPGEVMRNSHWAGKAKQAAAEAVRRLSDTASESELVAAAETATAVIVRLCLDELWKKELIADYWWDGYFSATEAERETAQDAVRQAFAQLQPGRTKEDLRKIRDKAVAPITERIKSREKRRFAEAQAEATVNGKLYIISEYLREECDFEDLCDQWKAERELKEELKPILVRRFVEGQLSPSDLREFIYEWLDDRLDDECDDEDDE